MPFKVEDGGWVKSWVDRGPFNFNLGSPEGNAAAGTSIAATVGGLAPFANNLGGMFGAYTGGLGAQGNNYTNAYGAYTQGIGDLGRSQSGAYNAYAGGLGQLGQAMAADRAGFYGANASAEAARQVALGNIGSSALSAYGGASNKALESWAQNQMAYNQALAGLGTANQAGLSQLGQSRNAALGNLGNAYADLGGKLGAASVLGNLNFNMSDGGMGGSSGFSATGPNGEIASGSYGGGGGGFSASGSRVSDASQLPDIGAPAYAGLGTIQRNLMAPDISGSMNQNYADALGRLDAQHYSSRSMPSQMLGQTLSGLMAMGRDAYGAVRGGMDQFYATQNDPANRADFTGAMDRLGGGLLATGQALDNYAGQMRTGFNETAGRIGSATDALTRGYRDASGALGDLFDNSIGSMEIFQSPARLAQRQEDAAAVQRRGEIQKLLQGLEDSEANNRLKALQYRNSPVENYANSGPGTTPRQTFVDNYTRNADQSKQERDLLRGLYAQTLNPNSPAVQSWINSQRDDARMQALRAEQERGLAEFDFAALPERDREFHGYNLRKDAARSAFARDRARALESLLG